MAPERKPRARVLAVDSLRFASGLRRISDEVAISPLPAAPVPAAVHVDIVRPADLVALSVDAVGCELLTDGAQPAHLRPLAKGSSAYLVVRFAFQHVGEEAIYEGQPDPDVLYDEMNPGQPQYLRKADSVRAPNARPAPPINARAARGSRLVFDIPAGDCIEFSTAGIIAAMGRLRLRVHALATPGDAPLRGTAGSAAAVPSRGDVPGSIVVGDLIGTVTVDAVTLRKASRKELRGVGVAADAATVAVARAAELRRTRVLLQTRPGFIEGAASIGGLADLGRRIEQIAGPIRRAGTHSRPPANDETSIEAPYRLIISPSSEAGWVHADVPQAAGDAGDHVELWHSRLATRTARANGSTFTDERSGARRIVRAVWTRDRDGMAAADWQDPTKGQPPHSDTPFRMSLDPADRQMLVQQSSETLRVSRRAIPPTPVAAHALWLSGLGAWLDLHGAWNTEAYHGIRSILGWDHAAPMGRDQYVRVVYPGYLYPWGHQAALVKVTERQMKDRSPSVASLYQRKFLMIGEPRRVYAGARDLPFVEAAIRPLMTPPLDDPGKSQDACFWPIVDGQPFPFVVDLLDHAGRPARLHMPLLWVAGHYTAFDKVDTAYRGSGWRSVEAHGQSIAFAPPLRGGDTRVTVDRLRFTGTAALGTSVPHMSSADVRIPAVETLSPSARATPIAYHDVYRQYGFSKPNPSGAWAKVLVKGETSKAAEDAASAIDLPVMAFGAGASSTSDRAGGFLAPNVPIRALTRAAGVVGDAGGMATATVKAKDFFSGGLPKLFGLIDLTDLLAVDSDVLRMPKVIGEFIGRIEALIAEVARTGQTIAEAMAEAQAMLASATQKNVAAMIQQARDAIDAAQSLQAYFGKLSDSMGQLLKFARDGGTSSAAENAAALFGTLVGQVTAGLEDLANKLPPFMAGVLRAVAAGLKQFVGDAMKLALDVAQYLSGIAEAGGLARVRFEWKPKLSSWPSNGAPLLEVQPDSLVLAVQSQVGLKGEQLSYASAELRNFTLHLFPTAELISLKFARFAFIVAGGKKPEVDIVFDRIGFHGVLSFVEDFKKLIPLDGFSDPPYVTVKPEGLTAGFDVALPNLAVGVFAITNLSLGADVQVPFLGKAMTVGFNFCTRENPFTLAVAFIGGGGWAGIRASAQGLEVLEIGLEAGACVAVNLGVASGSVSAMLGVYIRIETDKGSISGYFRLRGEVDVLGLVSASIELYMALVYHDPTGKLVGEASITVNVSVMGISKSVRVTAQRTFAGSNGDPSFMQVMGVDDTGQSPTWDTYCAAFLAEK